LRVFLFQLLSVMGNWDRALTQLSVLESMGSEEKVMATIFEQVVQCEKLRKEIFAGKRSPIIFGEPADWMGLLVQANELVGQGKYAAAQELREKAFDQAPATPGKLNDQPMEWIADADMRLGPVLEVVIEGHYYWVPICRIQRMILEPPTDLRDLVWAPVQFIWANGGEASGHIPTRYSGTEESSDSQLRLSRKTEWTEHEGGYSLGLGQRLLTTDREDVPLLECRTVDLEAVSEK